MPDRWMELAIGAGLGAACLLVAWLFPSAQIVTGALAAAFVLYQGHTLGRWLIPGARPFGAAAWGLLALFSIQAILQTIWYYAGGIGSTMTDVLALVSAAVILHVVAKFEDRRSKSEERTASETRYSIFDIRYSFLWLLTLAGGVAMVFILRSAGLYATTDAIRSPWALLPSSVFIAFALIAATSWLSSFLQATSYKLPPALIVSFFLAAIFLIAPLLYTNGFGFDGFLHRASELIFLKFGTLEPAPPYYIGQYAFVATLVRVFLLPLPAIDRWLVPALAALLPLLFFTIENRKTSGLRFASLILFLPLGAFVATTPQALAYLIGFLALWTTTCETHPVLSLSLAGWAIAIHPLAGLPLTAIALAILLIRNEKTKSVWRSVAAGACILATGIAVPAAFALNAARGTTQIEWSAAGLTASSILRAAFSFAVPIGHVALWSDWTDIVAFLIPFLAVACALVAIWRDAEHRRAWIVCLAGAASLWIAGVLLKLTGDFTFLIDYERGNYAERLFLIAQLSLLPAAAVGIERALVRRFSSLAPAAAVALLAGLSLAPAALAYNALPRHDAATIGHGWSVGRADQEAVRWIDRDAAARAYTVLANQSVSAAAVESLGFKRYANDVFFYPIPTGGPLYQVFLSATGDVPSFDDIKTASALGQSSLVYVVLNAYWWNADVVAERLQTLAGNVHDIDEGAVRIYKFEINK